MGNSRRSLRHRTMAEQMWWDGLSVDEQVAFTIGYSVGQQHPFPAPGMIAELRAQIDANHRGVRRSGVGGNRPLSTTPASPPAPAKQSPKANLPPKHSSTPVAASMAISTARKKGYHIPYVRNPKKARR